MNLIHPLVFKCVQALLILTDVFLISFKISSDRAIKNISSLLLLSDYTTVPTGEQQAKALQISSRQIYCKYNNTPKNFLLAKNS